MKKLKTINAGEEGILGYKAFEPDLTCRGFQYEVGKTYELENGMTPVLCIRGFHFCLKKENVFRFYEADDETRLCFVRAYGDVKTDGVKCVTGKIEILEEILDTDRDKNQGYWNTGTLNIGKANTGFYNAGDYNNGNDNVGECNEGSWNRGGENRGSNNIGTANVGDRNIGIGNVGNCNVGWCNVTSGAFGAFNTKPTPIYVFNKPFKGHIGQLKELHGRAFGVLLDLIRIRPSFDDFVRFYDPNPVLALEWIEGLPNFDPDIFEELTGLDYRKLKAFCLKYRPNSDDI